MPYLVVRRTPGAADETVEEVSSLQLARTALRKLLRSPTWPSSTTFAIQHAKPCRHPGHNPRSLEPARCLRCGKERVDRRWVRR